jgi:hypothetical protein
MANFGKFANLSPHGWTVKTQTQSIAIGQNAHIGLWGGGPAGEDLIVAPANPNICAVHEEPKPAGWPHWRHFLITALSDGETAVNASVKSGGAWATMTVRVTGRIGLHLVFFPGEFTDSSSTPPVVTGTIYAIGGAGEHIAAAGGRAGLPVQGVYDQGGHTRESTPPGQYVLGPKEHVITKSWPYSSIPWGVALRLNSDDEMEFEAPAGHWTVATGPRGSVTTAMLTFLRKDDPTATLQDAIDTVRTTCIDDKNHKLWNDTWKGNDFGRWGWNLQLNGKRTGYYVHTTPEDEIATEEGKAVFLANSHACIHIKPAERDMLMKAGFLREGVPFEVRPYSEKSSQ